MKSIYVAIANGGEWPAIDASDAQHLREEGVDLLVAGAVEASVPHAWPLTDRALLAKRRRDALARELVETLVLADAVRTLAEADVHCLILKGAAIARTHYAASWSRLRGDIDLLVSDDRLSQSEAALSDAGWQPAIEPTDAMVSGQRHFSHRHPAAPPLDLHVRLLAPVLDNTPTFTELWRSRQEVPGLGKAAWTLANPDALWYGCVHLALHHTGDASVLWLFDLDRVARSLDEAGWSAVAARARATETRALCAGVLDLVVDRFETPVPAAIGAWRDVPGEQTARFLSARSELGIQWLNLHALRGWRARAAWMRGHLLPDPGYMRERYKAHTHVALATAYTRRAASGALRWIGDALAGRR